MRLFDITFIGELPPPYGGVAVKDKLIFDQIFSGYNAQMIDMVECKRYPWKGPMICFRVASAMLCSKTIVIGMGTIRRVKVLLWLQKIFTGSRGLKKIMLIVMGGMFHDQVKSDNMLKHLVKGVGSIWVESDQMKVSLEQQGILHTYLFPNCRADINSQAPRLSLGKNLKLVFFSRICIEKGVDDIIKAFDLYQQDFKNITLDFYGELEEDIRDQFLQFVQSHESIRYHGTYSATNENVYEELNKYDAMLLLSKREGVAGALIESKMAGITAIVSNKGFNSEVVVNGKEGIVLEEPISENLALTVSMLKNNPEALNSLKKGAFKSRERYNMQFYEKKIREVIMKY